MSGESVDWIQTVKCSERRDHPHQNQHPGVCINYGIEMSSMNWIKCEGAHVSPQKKQEWGWIKGPPGRLKIHDLKDSHVSAQMCATSFAQYRNGKQKHTMQTKFSWMNLGGSRERAGLNFWIPTYILYVNIHLYTWLTVNQMRARARFMRHTAQFIY